MKYLTQVLLILGYVSIGFGILGTLGAVDSGSIDMKQAIIQCLICIGVGLACFAGRWVLNWLSHEKCNRKS